MSPSRRARTLACVAGLLGAAVGAAGCHDPVTEVVLVMQSDLSVPRDADQLTIAAQPGHFMPPPFSGIGGGGLPTFPQSIGFVSQSGNSSVFSVTIQVTRVLNGVTSNVVTRNIFGIHFVPEQTRMLIVPLMAVCACHGTSCPNPGVNPDCDDIDDPETVPFDPSKAPPSSPMSFF